MRKQKVLAILDNNFAGDLKSLARDQHVWILDSDANKPQIKQAHDSQRDYSQERGVTSFIMTGSPIETLYQILGTIDEHHPGIAGELEPWSVISVIADETIQVDIERLRSELGQLCTFEVKDGMYMIRRDITNASMGARPASDFEDL